MITNVNYNGNISINKVEVDENAYLDVDYSGNKIFWAEPQVYMGQRDLSAWQANEDSVIAVDGVEIQINRGDNVYALAELGISSHFYRMLPYLITLIVLAFTSKSSRAPKAEGIPYDPSRR